MMLKTILALQAYFKEECQFLLINHLRYQYLMQKNIVYKFMMDDFSCSSMRYSTELKLNNEQKIVGKNVQYTGCSKSWDKYTVML